MRLWVYSIGYEEDYMDEKGPYRAGIVSTEPRLVFADSSSEALALLKRRYQNGGETNRNYKFFLRTDHEIQPGIVDS